MMAPVVRTARQDERLASARDLTGAPRVHTIAPEMREAVALALAHAQARLALPTVNILWVQRPGGFDGLTYFRPDGRVEILLNASADLSPREVARRVLHEAKHAADGPDFCNAHYAEAEHRAEAFVAHITNERQTLDFCNLDWRRPSRRQREESTR
jgi:hypothetical protein